jgi:branched-chain amino acid transport system ATP-binding protein
MAAEFREEDRGTGLGNEDARASTDELERDAGRPADAGSGGGLDVEGVTVRFGGIVALDSADLQARTGEITGLIGPNGAGKTTLFNCLTGIYRAQSGSIRWQGKELLGMQPHKVAAQGIARTFQNLALFPRLTVRENVVVGLHRVRKTDWVSNAVRAPWVLAEERRVRRLADDALDEVGLSKVAGRPAAGLPYGTLKRVELARAIASDPDLLLLDEPAAGLAHGEVDELMALVRQLRDAHDLTVVLVEHHMGLVMRLCDHIAVLNFGRTISAGPPAKVSADPAVIEAYLGAA